MLATNELYVKKYNGENLDDEMEFDYISKGGEAPTTLEMIKKLELMVMSNANDAKKENATLKSKIATLESDAKKKDKENASLRTSFFTLTYHVKNNIQPQIEHLKSENAILKSYSKKEIAALQSRIEEQGQEIEEIRGKLKIVSKANL